MGGWVGCSPVNYLSGYILWDFHSFSRMSSLHTLYSESSNDHNKPTIFIFSGMVVRRLYNISTCMNFIALIFLLPLALVVSGLILWPAVIQYKIGELNIVFDPMLYVSVHCRIVNFMKTKNACLFLWLITSVKKTLSKYFLGCSFTGNFFHLVLLKKQANQNKKKTIETKQTNKIKQTKTQRKVISNSCILWLKIRVWCVWKGCAWGFILHHKSQQ